jgi:hypothetical protein
MPIYNEERNSVNAWMIVFWGVVAVLVVTLLVAVASALWGGRVATAGIYGRGQAHRRIESASNRIAKQELFEDLYAQVQAYDDQINVAAEATGANAATNLQGLKLICIDATAEYNAEAEKVSSEQFRDARLPERLGASLGRDFDCQEDK